MLFQCEVRWLVVVCWSCRCGVMKTLPGVENRLGDAISSAAGKPFPDTGSGLLLLQLMGNDSCGSHHLSVSRREDRDPGSLFKLRLRKGKNWGVACITSTYKSSARTQSRDTPGCQKARKTMLTWYLCNFGRRGE